MCNSMHAFHVNGSSDVVSTVTRALELLSANIDRIILRLFWCAFLLCVKTGSFGNLLVIEL